MALRHQKEKLTIDERQLKGGALVLRAINHKLRRRIIILLHERGTLTVKEIYSKLRLEQSVASSHLAILRNAGFINVKRESRKAFYSVNYSRLAEVHDLVAALLCTNNRNGNKPL